MSRIKGKQIHTSALIASLVALTVLDWKLGVILLIPILSWPIIFMSDRKLPWLKGGFLPLWLMAAPIPFFIIVAALLPDRDLFLGLVIYLVIQLSFIGIECLSDTYKNRWYLITAAVLRSWLVLVMPYAIFKQMQVVPILLGSLSVVLLWPAAYIGEWIKAKIFTEFGEIYGYIFQSAFAIVIATLILLVEYGIAQQFTTKGVWLT